MSYIIIYYFYRVHLERDRFQHPQLLPSRVARAPWPPRSKENAEHRVNVASATTTSCRAGPAYTSTSTSKKKDTSSALCNTHSTGEMWCLEPPTTSGGCSFAQTAATISTATSRRLSTSGSFGLKRSFRIGPGRLCSKRGEVKKDEGYLSPCPPWYTGVVKSNGIGLSDCPKRL